MLTPASFSEQMQSHPDWHPFTNFWIEHGFSTTIGDAMIVAYAGLHQQTGDSCIIMEAHNKLDPALLCSLSPLYSVGDVLLKAQKLAAIVT